MTEILIYIKHHCHFIWTLIESVNGCLFYCLFNKKLKTIKDCPSLNVKDSNYNISILNAKDMTELSEFFANQPDDSFRYFKPHSFDIKSLLKKNKNYSFIMIGVKSENKIVGYGFLRCFFNGKAFRGKIVDKDFQGQGIAKKIGIVLTDIATHLNMRLFATISKDNVKSISSSKAVNQIKIIKELPDNYIYVEYLPK